MFEEGERLRKKYGAENVFDFSIGNPDPEPPEKTVEALKTLVLSNQSGLHRYMSNAGYTEVRQAVAEHIQKTQDVELSFENVIMTCGAGGGLNVILKAIINPGDEVIIFSPYFVEYTYYVDNFDGVVVIVPTDPQTFLPDIDKLEQFLSPRTKAVIVNTPHNPTGVVYPKSLLMRMAKLLKEKERQYGSCIYVISDEPYREIVYDGVEVPSMFHCFDNLIVAYSYSKSLSLPGERIGYVAVNPGTCDADILLDALIFANRALGYVNAPALFQRVIANSIDSVVDTKIYKERRDLLYGHLIRLGFSCVKPQGAFYLFPRSPIPDTDQFMSMALKHNIVLVHGKGFGCPDHFRLSYCVSLEAIQNSMPALTALASEISMEK
jgi:aspartate aminotransferase